MFALDPETEARMYHYMHDNNGWDWFWMIPTMLLLILVLGGVVYAAVRLALQHQHKPPPVGQ
jgi:hypothetical protein